MQGSVEIKKVEKTVITEEKVYNLQLTHKEFCSILTSFARTSLGELSETVKQYHLVNFDVFTIDEYKDYCNFYDNMKKLIDTGKQSV